MKKDFLQECMSSINIENQDVSEFKDLFCQRCWNPDCRRAGQSETSWYHRVSTQVRRLLENPNIANYNDPKFYNIIKQKFEDKRREALKIEIANKKGDWTVPSEEEIEKAQQGPSSFLSQESFEETVEDVRQEILSEEKNSLIDEDALGPSREFSEEKSEELDEALGMLKGLKKIREAQKEELEGQKSPPSEKVKVPKPTTPKEVPLESPRNRVVSPQTDLPTSVEDSQWDNTPVPEEGIYLKPKKEIQKEKAQEVKDPWAPPSSIEEDFVEIGATIQLGKNTKKKKD